MEHMWKTCGKDEKACGTHVEQIWEIDGNHMKSYGKSLGSVGKDVVKLWNIDGEHMKIWKTGTGTGTGTQPWSRPRKRYTIDLVSRSCIFCARVWGFLAFHMYSIDFHISCCIIFIQ